MKNTILMLLFTGSSFAVYAQDTTTKQMDTMHKNMQNNMPQQMMRNDSNARVTNNNYNAYGNVNLPPNVSQSFSKAYPMATNAQWQQTGNGLWRVTYNNNGQDMNMYYGSTGQGFLIALPVVENMVPESILNNIRSKYGYNAYDVTRMKSNDSQYVYSVRIIENGQTRMETMNDDGSAMVSQMNNANMEMKKDSMNMMNKDSMSMMNKDSMNMMNNRNVMKTDSTNSMDSSMKMMNRNMDTTNKMKMDTLKNNDTTGMHHDGSWNYKKIINHINSNITELFENPITAKEMLNPVRTKKIKYNKNIC